jgi:alpha-galactosidase
MNRYFTFGLAWGIYAGWLMCATAQTNSQATEMENLIPSYAPDQILTPPPNPAPRINGAKVFGARPGSPFLFRVAASGEKPLTFSASRLPGGL